MTTTTDFIFKSVRDMPLMISAKQAIWILGIARATFYRRIADGSIEPGVKLGPNTRRWRKDYIVSLIGGNDPEASAAPTMPRAPSGRGPVAAVG